MLMKTGEIMIYNRGENDRVYIKHIGRGETAGSIKAVVHSTVGYDEIPRNRLERPKKVPYQVEKQLNRISEIIVELEEKMKEESNLKTKEFQEAYKRGRVYEEVYRVTVYAEDTSLGITDTYLRENAREIIGRNDRGIRVQVSYTKDEARIHLKRRERVSSRNRYNGAELVDGVIHLNEERAKRTMKDKPITRAKEELEDRGYRLITEDIVVTDWQEVEEQLVFTKPLERTLEGADTYFNDIYGLTRCIENLKENRLI